MTRFFLEEACRLPLFAIGGLRVLGLASRVLVPGRALEQQTNRDGVLTWREVHITIGDRCAGEVSNDRRARAFLRQRRVPSGDRGRCSGDVHGEVNDALERVAANELSRVSYPTVTSGSRQQPRLEAPESEEVVL